jgi:hypothetical protein
VVPLAAGFVTATVDFVSVTAGLVMERDTVAGLATVAAGLDAAAAGLVTVMVGRFSSLQVNHRTKQNVIQLLQAVDNVIQGEHWHLNYAGMIEGNIRTQT